jgi:hypothetical protein
MTKFDRDENGDLKIVDRRFVLTSDRKSAIALRIQDAFAVVRNEFDLDTLAGFEYYPEIMGAKGPDLGLVRSLYLRKLVSIGGVRGATISVSFDSHARTLAVNGSVITSDGETLDIRDGQVMLLAAE